MLYYPPDRAWPRGGIGRHEGLKIPCRKASEFDPRRGHHRILAGKTVIGVVNVHARLPFCATNFAQFFVSHHWRGVIQLLSSPLAVPR